jgi:hypothetical protein
MTMILYSSTSAKSPVISMVMGDFCYVKVLNSGEHGYDILAVNSYEEFKP